MGLIVVAAVTVTIVVPIALHMVHGAAIAFFEAVAEFSAIPLINGRVLVDLMIVGIGMTMVHEITTGCLNTFAEPLALRITVLVGSAIPVAIAILVLVLVLRRAGLRRSRIGFLRAGLDGDWRGHAEGKSWN